MKHIGLEFRHKITRRAVWADVQGAARPAVAGGQTLSEFRHRPYYVIQQGRAPKQGIPEM